MKNVHRYTGYLNSYLFIMSVIVKFCFLIIHLIGFYFQDEVKMQRLFDLVGFQLTLRSKIKVIYNMHKEAISMFTLFLLIWCFSIIMNTFEVQLGTLSGAIETVYYLIISMFTIGYGDIVAQSTLGQQSMIFGTFMGIGIEAMFIIAFSKLSQFDEG
jgi:hypothetical protein